MYERERSTSVLIDNMIAAINIEDAAGDELGAIERQKRSCVADVVDTD
jgi:hypothetical protein